MGNPPIPLSNSTLKTVFRPCLNFLRKMLQNSPENLGPFVWKPCNCLGGPVQSGCQSPETPKAPKCRKGGTLVYLQLKFFCLQLIFCACSLFIYVLSHQSSHCKQKSSPTVSKNARSVSKKAQKHNCKQRSLTVSRKCPTVHVSKKKAASTCFNFKSRRKLYTPPPPFPHFWPKGIFQGRGGGGVYFEPPRGRNFIRPPLLCAPHP